MRYAEQLKHSLVYHWEVMLKCWDILTLGKVKWVLFFIFGILFVAPLLVDGFFTPGGVRRYLSLSQPMLTPHVAQVLALHYFPVKEPPVLLALNYHWLHQEGFKQMAKSGSGIMAVILLVAYLRGE